MNGWQSWSPTYQIEESLQYAKEKINSGKYDMIILDEINNIIVYKNTPTAKAYKQKKALSINTGEDFFGM